MWNTPSRKRLAQIPALYATESIRLQDKLIYLHFFLGSCDWFVAEFNGKDTFWGFVVLNGDLLNAEFGYFNLSELAAIQVYGGMEIDCELEEHWKIKPASEVVIISEAQGWNMPIKVQDQFKTASF